MSEHEMKDEAEALPPSDDAPFAAWPGARLRQWLRGTRLARLLGVYSAPVGRQIWAAALPRRLHVPSDPDLAFMNPNALIGRGRLIVAVFLLGFGLWAVIVPLDSALMAPGVLVVESHRKTIQHLEGGIVADILVKDGQVVKTGQTLIRLDETQARASLAALQGQRDALAAQEARLAAERDGKDHIDFPADLLARKSDPAVAAAIAGEESTFNTRHTTLSRQIDILLQRNRENRTIIAGLKAQQQALATQSQLMKTETSSVQSLYDKGLATLPRLSELKRSAADLGGNSGQTAEKIAQTQISIGENNLQIENLRNQQLSDIVKQLRDVQTQEYDVADKLTAARDIVSRTRITAPVTGTVVNLSVHTRGAVIKPGESVMDIVPVADKLEVDARVRPEDADAVHPGMTARINLSAYKQRRLPIIAGAVQTISADRLTDEKTGQAYFDAKILVDRGALADYPEARLIPGLPVEVAIDTGSRTLFRYLTEPISDAFWRGMRER
jgi:HlyD family type I secretion membrane fusion protein